MAPFMEQKSNKPTLKQSEIAKKLGYQVLLYKGIGMI